ncbi:MAG: YggT family protein [Cellvibrionales bacterium]|jgi:YggT family protein
MDALNEIAGYLVETAASLYLILIILRGMLQTARADFYNPISQFVVRATSGPLTLLHRFIPNMRTIDPALWLLALLIQAVAISATLLLAGFALPNVLLLLAWSAIGVVGLLVNAYLIAMVIMIVVSWVAPGSRHPAIVLTYQVTEPVMAPVRRMLPDMGGLDFSPILVFIVINIIQIALRHMAAAVGLPLQLVIGI